MRCWRCVEELRSASSVGVLRWSAGPDTATVVHPGEESAPATDGPYVESKEHLGGLAIITASDLDEALEWARKLARATTLPIEVRPFAGDGEG